MMSDSKILMSYDFNNNIINTGDNQYSFSQFNGPYNVLNGYIGNAIISTNTFNIDRDWTISFYYTLDKNVSNVWNHIFAFGLLNSETYAIGIYNVNLKTIPLYILKNIDNLEHFYEISYIKRGLKINIKIDGKFVNTLEDIEFKKEQVGLYLNASYGNPQIIAKIRKFKFEIFYDIIEVETEVNTILRSTLLQQTNLKPQSKVLINYSSSIPVIQKNVITLNSISNDISISRQIMNIDNEYLVNLNFDDDIVQDFGTLKFSWSNPQQQYFVKDKFDPGNMIKKSLYLNGEYSICNSKNYINLPEIKDFCIELDFIVDENIVFSTPYSRIYLLSSNINTHGEYHSALADIYLLPKYKDKVMSLTIESNDLYRNTGNIIYTYGWIKTNTIYRLIYVRENNRFYILINDELVYDKELENSILYEEGYSKPNRRYFGKNYITSLELGLGTSVIPTNTQDKFIGYIDKFNISGNARYDNSGKPTTVIPAIDKDGKPVINPDGTPKHYTSTFPYSRSFHVSRIYDPVLLLDGKSIHLKPNGVFIINGFTIKAGSGGATLIGGPGCGTTGIIGVHPGWYGGRIYIYSGPGSVTITGPFRSGEGYITRTWIIPGNGYYGIIYYGLVTIFIYTIELNIYGILHREIVFVGDGEIYNLNGYSIYGPVGGIIIYKKLTGWYIGYHKYPAKVIHPSGIISYITPGYFGILYNGTFYIDYNPAFIKGRGFPLPYWVKLCPDPYNYPPGRIQVIEEDILVYVPCHVEEFHDDVIYSKVLPREENYQAIKIRGKFYKDFWRENYGAIGPE